MKRRFGSYVLYSFLINMLGVFLISGVDVWNFALWIFAPLGFYWIALVLTTVRLPVRETSVSAKIAAGLLVGQLTQVLVVFFATYFFGAQLARLFTDGVKLTELLFTNSMNAFMFGSLIATIGSFLIVQFYFSRPTFEHAEQTPQT